MFTRCDLQGAECDLTQPRHASLASLSRPQEHPAHREVHRVVADEVQGFLEPVKTWRTWATTSRLPPAWSQTASPSRCDAGLKERTGCGMRVCHDQSL